MKKLFVAALAMSGVSYAIADNNISYVDHVVTTPERISVIPMQIQGINQVVSIVDAGQYSWAIGRQKQVAFYNGSVWTGANNIPGMATDPHHTMFIIPAYPGSGKNGEAWAMYNGNDTPHPHALLSHFDGHYWSSSPYDAAKILGIPSASKDSYFFDMDTAGGYVFLVASDTNGSGTYLSVYSPVSQRWSRPAFLSHYILAGNEGYNAGYYVAGSSDDANPYATASLMSTNSSSKPTILTINKDGSYAVGFLSQIGSIWAKDFATYVSSCDHTNDICYNSQNNPTTWTTTELPNVLQNTRSPYLFPYSINSGIICVDNQALSKDGFQFSCVDTKKSGLPTWQPIVTIPPNGDDGAAWFYTQARPDGAWVYWGQDVYSYTIKNGKGTLTDTKFSTQPGLPSSYDNAVMISPTQLVVCASKKGANLYSYDLGDQNPKWQTIAMKGSRVNHCDASWHDNGELHGSGFWLYDQSTDLSKTGHMHGLRAGFVPRSAKIKNIHK